MTTLIPVKDIQKFKDSPPALVVLDLGNSDLKAMIVGKPNTETILQHELVYPQTAHYERMAKRASIRQVEYKGAEFFTKIYKDGSSCPVMIGEGVTQNARSNKITGEAKYQEQYFDLLLAAMLKRLLPQGHDNIWIALATPSDAIDYLEIIKPIVGGLHKISTLSGDTIKFNVKRLIFFDEANGGIMRFLERNERERKPVHIAENQRIIIVDIGGKISSMTVVGIGEKLEPTVLYTESPEPFNVGIIDVLDNFGRELKGLHPSEFQTYKTAASIPLNMRQEGIQTGKITLSGESFDVRQARINALSNIADEIESRYVNDMQGGKNAAHIVITGGGGGLLTPLLRTDILRHKSVHLADEIAEINLANLRGGNIAFIEWLESKGFIEYA